MRERVVEEFMTANPVCVALNTPVHGAHAAMRGANVRHLVVMDGERLAGIVSQRDLYLIETLTDADPASAIVEEAMSAEPYIVSPVTSLSEVARTMWRERHSSAIVVRNEEVVGIFTAVDALHALADLLADEVDEVVDQTLND